MSKLRIFWDIDCVLADMIPQVCNRVKLQYGIDLKPQQITQWDLTKVTGKSDISKIFDSNMYFQQVPFPEAVKYLPTIWDKTESYLATYCMNGGFDAKKKWLKNHFPFINIENNLIFLKYKSLLRGDVIVDDNFQNCLKWLKNNSQGTAIMPAYPYNEKQRSYFYLSGQLKRVRTWQGIQAQVDSLIRERIV